MKLSISANYEGGTMGSQCECPRCGTFGLERLATYSHCSNCLYFEDYFEDFQSSAYKASAIEREVCERDEPTEEDETDDFDLAS